MNEKAIVNNNFDEKTEEYFVHEENDREVKLAPFMNLQIGVSTVQINYKHYIRITFFPLVWGKGCKNQRDCVCCRETP